MAISKTLGHCDTTMLEKVYMKYKEKIVGITTGEEDVVLMALITDWMSLLIWQG